MENAAFGSGITVREALGRIDAALSDYCLQAQTLHDEQKFTVDIPGSLPLSKLRQVGCELKQDLDASVPAVCLTMELLGDTTTAIEHDGKTTEFLNFLKGAGITVKSSRVVGSKTEEQKAEIEIEPRIERELLFARAGFGDYIKLELRNHENLGISNYLVKPHQVGTDFLEQLHRFLAHKPNHFLEQIARKMTDVEELEEATIQANVEDFVDLPSSAEILSFEEHAEAGKAGAETIELCFRDLAITFDRNQPVCHMGRKFPADILIRSKFVSRDHATLVYENGEFTLHDHSSNGSYVQIGSRPVNFLHNEAMILEKSGRISLGVSFEGDTEDFVEFSIG